MTSYLVIFNPVSGRGHGRTNAAILAGRLSGTARVEVAETEARGSASDLAATRGRDFDRVIAVGGDGTLNEVLSGLWAIERSADETPELGFLPSGTANAATSAFGFEGDPVRLAELLPRLSSRPVDVGVVRTSTEERPFLLWCGAGYDAVVIGTLNASRTGRMGTIGLALNAPRVARDMAVYVEPAIEAEIDGERWNSCGGVVVANVGAIAFGGSLGADVDPFDGRLDVIGAPAGSKSRLPGIVLSILRSRLRRHPAVRMRQGTHVALRSNGDVPYQLDGEPAGSLPIDVRAEPARIRLLCGREG